MRGSGPFGAPHRLHHTVYEMRGTDNEGTNIPTSGDVTSTTAATIAEHRTSDPDKKVQEAGTAHVAAWSDKER